MPYKVFLVEDEIAAREGIRDNVDWRSLGFEFCGEAQDGEIAIPLIEAAQPDVLITDIKMPFMDGLQLSKIVREHMPWMKIIIISGHDEFAYAQSAIKLGVSEYLLKPVSVQDLTPVLRKIAEMLNQENNDRAYLKQLHSQVEDHLALRREKFLLRLVMGGESTLSAIEQSQQLGLSLLSPFYQIILIKIRPANREDVFTLRHSELIETILRARIGVNVDAFAARKDLDEFILIFKGADQEELEQEGWFMAELLQREIEEKAGCRASIYRGSPQRRLGDLHRSFTEALVQLKGDWQALDGHDLQKLDHAALMRYLEYGRQEEFDTFFEHSIRPLAEAALHSDLLKQYILVDVVLSAAQFISDLGGDVDQIIPEIHRGDAFLSTILTLEQIKREIQRSFSAALTFRDSQVHNDRSMIVRQARAYILSHFSDSELSLNQVATQVNFSPNHFSAVFSNETGETFRDYLTQTRIEHAKKLLRSTTLKCAEVAVQSGYNDPHYFSIQFRKNVGLTPQQFRDLARKQKSG